MQYIISLIVILLFNNCVGIGIVYGHNYEAEYDEEYKPYNRYNQIDCNKTNEINKLTYTYGKPQIETQENGVEKYTFKEWFVFRGIVPMLIIPIPILFPIGYNEHIMLFEGNKCLSYKYEYTTWEGFACGIENEGTMELGCAKLK